MLLKIGAIPPEHDAASASSSENQKLKACWLALLSMRCDVMGNAYFVMHWYRRQPDGDGYVLPQSTSQTTCNAVCSVDPR
ncbi:hypothetical protein Aduo_005513 [Ancylostoma duodenale]